MKWSFSRKYDGSARQQLKIQPCRVSTLAVQLDTPHSILRNGVNGSFAPIGWPRKGGRNSDSTTQAKESSVCFLSGEQMPATGVDKWYYNPDEGALNEVSSLANEKFISSRNKYGAKGKAVLVSGKPNSQVYLATHKINGSTPRKSATGESPGKTDS